MIMLEVTKKQSFTLSLEDTFLEKPQEEGGCQIEPPPPPTKPFKSLFNRG